MRKPCSRTMVGGITLARDGHYLSLTIDHAHHGNDVTVYLTPDNAKEFSEEINKLARMKPFEVGKYYLHQNEDTIIHILCIASTEGFGDTFIAEEFMGNVCTIQAYGMSYEASTGWKEVSQDVWIDFIAES